MKGFDGVVYEPLPTGWKKEHRVTSDHLKRCRVWGRTAWTLLIPLPTTRSFLKGILDKDSFSMRVQTVKRTKQDVRKDLLVSKTFLIKQLTCWSHEFSPITSTKTKHTQENYRGDNSNISSLCGIIGVYLWVQYGESGSLLPTCKTSSQTAENKEEITLSWSVWAHFEKYCVSLECQTYCLMNAFQTLHRFWRDHVQHGPAWKRGLLMFVWFPSLRRWPTNYLPVGLEAHLVKSVCDLCTGQNGSVAAKEVRTHCQGQQPWQHWAKEGRKNMEQVC